MMFMTHFQWWLHLFQGVGNNKIMRMSLPGGEHIKTWRYSTMKVFIITIHLYKIDKLISSLVDLSRPGMWTGRRDTWWSSLKMTRMSSSRYISKASPYSKGSSPPHFHFQHICVAVPFRGLQSDSRVHRRLHLPLNEKQREQPATQPRALPQVDRRMGLIKSFSKGVYLHASGSWAWSLFLSLWSCFTSCWAWSSSSSPPWSSWSTWSALLRWSSWLTKWAWLTWSTLSDWLSWLVNLITKHGYQFDLDPP